MTYPPMCCVFCLLLLTLYLRPCVPPCVCAPYLLGCTSFTGAVSLLSRHLAVLSRARRLCRDWHLVLVCTEDDIEHAALPDAGDQDGPALRAYFTRVARVADAISVPTATLAAVDASGRSCVSPALVASAHACGLAVFARWLHDGVAHQAVVPPPPAPGSSSVVPADGVASGGDALPAETGQPPRGSPGSPKGISAGARALRDALPEYVLRCCCWWSTFLVALPLTCVVGAWCAGTLRCAVQAWTP